MPEPKTNSPPPSSPQPQQGVPVRFRLRADLEAGTQEYGGKLCYVLKDPVTLSYFRFAPKEYRVLQLLTGKTIAEVCDAVEQQGDERPTEEDLTQFLSQLIGSGLVVRDGFGDGRMLHNRREAIRWMKRRSLMGSLLYIKFPGFDPVHVLDWLYPRFWWMYSTVGVLVSVSLMLYAAGFTLIHLDEFVSRVKAESLESFFSWWTLLWLWIALGAAKVIHEFGHGLTCRHFGGECHEMGFLLLVFSPALYCDTTDAWTMPNKWHRIAISAGGIYVELIIASISTLTWWYTQPGTAHSIAFALMSLTSLTTFLVNANPLMRYDGYYILSDLLEIPNLRAKSAMAMQSLVDRYVLGIRDASAPQVEGRRWLFLTYAVLSWLYSWFLSIVILWFFYNVLKPYRLSSLSVALAAVVAFQMLALPVWRNVMRVNTAAKTSRKINWLRASFSAAVLAGLVYAAIVVPIPRRVWGVLTVEGIGQQAVVVPIPGRIESIDVAPGDKVQSGDVLVRLVNPELDSQIEYLEHRLRSVSIAAEKFFALERPGEEQTLHAQREKILEELATRKEQHERLTIRADQSGRVVSAPREHHRVSEIQGYESLASWEVHPLSSRNVGARLEVNTVLCELQPEDEFEAVVLVEQTDVAFLKPEQSVDIKLDAFPQRTLQGRVTQIARVEVDIPPPQLLISKGGELPVRLRSDGQYGLPGAYYEVRVALEGFKENGVSPNELLATGLRGRAKIECGEWTCWDIAVRELNKLFRM
ncbi:MAG: HlyD family efflux transporter periplasmic adaptor subunit [Planctomycetaceae bacterium]|nr:HlyD family efflux transporter periplasmic adaptor subunit [Planctomycetaceae bacterium]